MRLENLTDASDATFHALSARLTVLSEELTNMEKMGFRVFIKYNEGQGAEAVVIRSPAKPAIALLGSGMTQAPSTK